MSRIRKILSLISLCMALGCSRPPITAGSLAGTWLINVDSRRLLNPEIQRARLEMILEKSGSMTLNEVPREMFGDFLKSDPPIPGPISGSGSWVFRTPHSSAPEVLLALKSVIGRSSPTHIARNLIVGGSWKRPTLCFYLGDPDNAPMIVFEKL